MYYSHYLIGLELAFTNLYSFTMKCDYQFNLLFSLCLLIARTQDPQVTGICLFLFACPYGYLLPDDDDDDDDTLIGQMMRIWFVKGEEQRHENREREEPAFLMAISLHFLHARSKSVGKLFTPLRSFSLILKRKREREN